MQFILCSASLSAAQRNRSFKSAAQTDILQPNPTTNASRAASQASDGPLLGFRDGLSRCTSFLALVNTVKCSFSFGCCSYRQTLFTRLISTLASGIIIGSVGQQWMVVIWDWNRGWLRWVQTNKIKRMLDLLVIRFVLDSDGTISASVLYHDDDHLRFFMP